MSGTMPVGPAMTTLRSVIAFIAATVRIAGIAYTLLAVVIWHQFYFDPGASWRLAAPAVAMAWGVVMAAYLYRSRPTPLLACADCAVYVTLAISAASCVPPGARDAAVSWLVISMSGQLIVPAWYAPGALFTPLALLSPAAYLVGALTQPGADARKLAVPAILLLVVGFVHVYGRRQLYGQAAAADAALAWTDQAASEQFAIMSATIERREHERLVHDTVLNTLTALGRATGDDVTGSVHRCRQDVALIEAALGDPSELAAAARHPSGDLLGELRAVVAGMRARGLAVRLEVGEEGVPAVPARVATALSSAAREALSNVVTHAGTGEARLRVRVTLADDPEAPCRLDVVVRDYGTGFDLDQVDPARLGLRRSISERIADCGGRADIWSAPGRGTAIRLSWPASTVPASTLPASTLQAPGSPS